MSECLTYGGFSFCGVDCAKLKLEYVPDNPNTYVFRPSKYSVHEQGFDAHDGGYFYGTTVQPKEFKLRCIYQYEHMNNGFMTTVLNFFKRGRTGRLIFDKRPWVYYNATVVDIDSSQMTNYMNGFITITMKAYYPFGRQDITTIPAEIPEDYPYNVLDLKANSALMQGMEWDTTTDWASDPITLDIARTFLLYNPGTERAPVALRIAGDFSQGIRITNNQTKQSCVIRGLNTTEGADSNKTLVIDSLSGKVLLEDMNGNHTYGFLYHDGGFLDIDSCFPTYRDILVTGRNTEQVLHTDAVFTDDLVGRHINFVSNGENNALLGSALLGQIMLNAATNDAVSALITGVSEDGSSLTINRRLDGAIYSRADVVLYNEIVVAPLNNSTATITKLIFDYKPTYN